MSQFGMQMPGGQSGVRRPSPDVYTALMVFAALTLAVATGFVLLAGQRVAPEGSPIGLQEPGRIQLVQDAGS